jgi:hypothetical protein
MSEPEEPPPEQAADDVTVGAWADVDKDWSSQRAPESDDVVIESTAKQPTLWARIMAGLRGGS